LKEKNNKSYNHFNHIYIYDSYGKMVINSQFKEKLNLNSLQNGIYFLILNNENAALQITEKFIISR